jgi:hypothetical protein
LIAFEVNGLISSALYGSASQQFSLFNSSIEQARGKGLTTVDIIILWGHSLNHDHTSRMALEEIIDKGNEHDDSSWRGDERESG